MIAVAFTRMPPEQNPNVGASGEDQAAAYFRAMVVTFASLTRLGHDQLTLVTDADPPAPFRDQLESVGVRTAHVEFGHRPPAGFSSGFNGSLYTVDAVAHLCSQAPGETVILIDPDCLAVRKLDAIFERAATTGIAAFPTGFAATEHSNGLNAIEAVRLHQCLDPELRGVPVHYGGECYAFDTAAMKTLLPHVEAAWRLALEGCAAGEPHFTTEEHLFNYALRYASVAPLTGEVKRIWTAATFRNVSGQEDDLALWHLPSEKGKGFDAVHAAVLDRSSWFWTSTETDFRSRAARLLGIRRNPGRWGYDTAARAVRRLRV